MQTLKLRKPLLVNGKTVSQLTYDINSITAEQFCMADAYAKAKCAEVNTVNLSSVELDNSLQMYLGFYSIISVNPDIDIKDLERVSGFDAIEIMKIGRNFTRGVEEEDETEETEDSTQETSDTPCEATQESTTPAI